MLLYFLGFINNLGQTTQCTLSNKLRTTHPIFKWLKKDPPKFGKVLLLPQQYNLSPTMKCCEYYRRLNTSLIDSRRGESNWVKGTLAMTQLSLAKACLFEIATSRENRFHNSWFPTLTNYSRNWVKTFSSTRKMTWIHSEHSMQVHRSIFSSVFSGQMMKVNLINQFRPADVCGNNCINLAQIFEVLKCISYRYFIKVWNTNIYHLEQNIHSLKGISCSHIKICAHLISLFNNEFLVK